jgi:hypothetical protein
MFFDPKSLDFDSFEFLTFASPERRCLYSLNPVGLIGRMERAWIGTFEDYSKSRAAALDEHDAKAIDQYHDNLRTIEQHIGTLTRQIEKLKFKLNLLEPFDESLGAPNPFRAPLVVDISCAPRGHLLAMLNYLARCQLADFQQVALAYSLVTDQAASEDAYSYGMQDVAVVPGFYGQMRLKHDLLILALGFEGNRAFSLYRRLAPNKTYLIVGDTQDEERPFYLQRSRINNHALITIYGNTVVQMPSRDPFEFARHFRQFLIREIEPISKSFNVYFSCLGTKLQALGAFLALQSHPYVQVELSAPRR